MIKVKKIVLFVFLASVFMVPVCYGQGLTELIASTQGEVVEGKDGWMFFKEELEHMTSGPFWGAQAAEVSKTAKKEFADPVPAIVDFNNQLKALGIELLLVPVPPKGLIYAEELPADSSQDVARLNETYDSFYSLLAGEGVEVVDLRKLFREKHKEEKLYCKTDTHYSGKGISLVTDELVKRISSKSWYGEEKKDGQYGIEKRNVAINGDLLKMAGKQGSETVELQFVVNAETAKAPEPSDMSSVLLLGDSHTLVFSAGGDLYASGAGLFENLAARLQMDLDRIGVRGSGATPSRIKLYQKARRDPSYLGKKKMVIWCFTTREFTGIGGWRKVPVTKN